MIVLKVFLLLIIFSTCTGIGFFYGNKFSNRFENLVYLQQCLKILETEIIYGSTPLPDALSNVYNKGNIKVSFIFEEIKKDLLKNKRDQIYESFLSVKELLYEKICLKKSDVEVFISLGRVLGTSDREDQQKNFILILNQIKNLILEAKEEKNRNEKLYRSLGLITGVGIIILLV
jgi:stage III sporulation protein AB